MRNSKRPQEGKGEFSCLQCGSRFLTLQALGGHKSVHTGKKNASWTTKSRLWESTLLQPSLPQSLSDCAAPPSKRARHLTPDRLSDPIASTPYYQYSWAQSMSAHPSSPLNPFYSHTSLATQTPSYYPNPLKAPPFSPPALAPPHLLFRTSEPACLASDDVSSCQLARAAFSCGQGRAQRVSEYWQSRRVGNAQAESFLEAAARRYSAATSAAAAVPMGAEFRSPNFSRSSDLNLPAESTFKSGRFTFGASLGVTEICQGRSANMTAALTCPLESYGLSTATAGSTVGSAEDALTPKNWARDCPPKLCKQESSKRGIGGLKDSASKTGLESLPSKPGELGPPTKQTSCKLGAVAGLPRGEESMDLTLRLSLF